jgi:probable phosphoglycerate mutase
MVTSLLMVRHGQSTWNAERRWQGQADPPLSDLGRDQAKRAADSLVSIAATITAAATSPQIRASETASILVEHSDATAHVESIEHEPGLRERSAGPWSGLTKTDIEARYPGYLSRDLRPPGYELDDSLFDRVHRTLVRIGHQHQDETVLVVCHGGVINTLVGRLGVDAGRTPNLSGYHVGLEGGVLTVSNRFDLLSEPDRTGGDSNRV